MLRYIKYLEHDCNALPHEASPLAISFRVTRDNIPQIEPGGAVFICHFECPVNQLRRDAHPTFEESTAPPGKESPPYWRIDRPPAVEIRSKRPSRRHSILPWPPFPRRDNVSSRFPRQELPVSWCRAACCFLLPGRLLLGLFCGCCCSAVRGAARAISAKVPR